MESDSENKVKGEWSYIDRLNLQICQFFIALICNSKYFSFTGKVVNKFLFVNILIY